MYMNEMMDSFIDTYGVERTGITGDDCEAAAKLIWDELEEFEKEFEYEFDFYNPSSLRNIPDDEINKQNVAKEMADIIYVTAQRMRRMGIDVDAVMAEVHRSNMSKRVTGNLTAELEVAKERYPDVVAVEVEAGVYVLRSPSTGKVIKPSCYSAAVITNEMVGV